MTSFIGGNGTGTSGLVPREGGSRRSAAVRPMRPLFDSTQTPPELVEPAQEPDAVRLEENRRLRAGVGIRLRRAGRREPVTFEGPEGVAQTRVDDEGAVGPAPLERRVVHDEGAEGVCEPASLARLERLDVLAHRLVARGRGASDVLALVLLERAEREVQDVRRAASRTRPRRC